jgi:hypothetical protein
MSDDLERLADLEVDPRTRAWAWIRDRIVTWPALASLEPPPVFYLPETKGFDNTPPGETLSIKLSPVFETMAPYASSGTRDVYEAPLKVTLLVTCPGFRAELSHAVWAEVQLAVSGADLNGPERWGFKEAMRAIGLHHPVFEKPADSLAGGESGEGSIRGICYVTL